MKVSGSGDFSDNSVLDAILCPKIGVSLIPVYVSKKLTPLHSLEFQLQHNIYFPMVTREVQLGCYEKKYLVDRNGVTNPYFTLLICNNM